MPWGGGKKGGARRWWPPPAPQRVTLGTFVHPRLPAQSGDAVASCSEEGGSPSPALAGIGWGDPRRAPPPWPASSGPGEAVPPCRCRHSHPAIHTGGNLNWGRTLGRGGQSTCSPPPPIQLGTPAPPGIPLPSSARRQGVRPEQAVRRSQPRHQEDLHPLADLQGSGMPGWWWGDTIILPRGFWGGGASGYFLTPPDPLPAVARHRSTRFTNAARCRVGPRTLTCWWPS